VIDRRHLFSCPQLLLTLVLRVRPPRGLPFSYVLEGEGPAEPWQGVRFTERRGRSLALQPPGKTRYAASVPDALVRQRLGCHPISRTSVPLVLLLRLHCQRRRRVATGPACVLTHGIVAGGLDTGPDVHHGIGHEQLLTPISQLPYSTSTAGWRQSGFGQDRRWRGATNRFQI